MEARPCGDLQNRPHVSPDGQVAVLEVPHSEVVYGGQDVDAVWKRALMAPREPGEAAETGSPQDIFSFQLLSAQSSTGIHFQLMTSHGTHGGHLRSASIIKTRHCVERVSLEVTDQYQCRVVYRAG